MDWIQALLITFLGIGIIDLAVALVVSWLVARWFRSLKPAHRTAVLAFSHRRRSGAGRHVDRRRGWSRNDPCGSFHFGLRSLG